MNLPSVNFELALILWSGSFSAFGKRSKHQAFLDFW